MGSAKPVSDRLVAELSAEFQSRNRTICCRELIGHDPGMAKERAKLRDQGLLVSKCGKDGDGVKSLKKSRDGGSKGRELSRRWSERRVCRLLAPGQERSSVDWHPASLYN